VISDLAVYAEPRHNWLLITQLVRLMVY